MYKIFYFIFLLLISTLSFTQVSAAEWELSGDMVDGREWHSAIKLDDGRVLATGSWIWDQASNSSEIYDPASGSWSDAGSVLAAGASLTLLSDGRVLLAGGEVPDYWSGATPTNSAYIFNPSTNSWRQTAYLKTSSSQHAGVLLPDGTVLIAGGLGKTTQIFNPVSETWSYGQDMNFSHYTDSLVSLPDGKAMIVGSGSASYGGYTANVEIYDPASKRWNIVSPLNVARGELKTVVLANGNIMAIGGFNNDGTSQTSAEVYDPSADTWTLTGPMAFGSHDFSATALADGKVLVTGGLIDEQEYRAEVYLPSNNTWELAGDMPIPRMRHIGTLLENGKVLIAGGISWLNNVIDFSLASVLYTFSGTTPQPPITPIEPVSIHVSDLTGSSIAKGKRYWQAVATMTVKDDLGNLMSNAVVSGDWGSRVTGETSCTTNSIGVCSMKTNKIKYYNVIFKIKDISHKTLSYDPGANLKTQINIDRPF